MSAITNNSTANPQNGRESLQRADQRAVPPDHDHRTRQPGPAFPTESKDLLAQIGTIRSIESDLALKTSLESLVKQNELSSAGGLVGKYVNGLTTNGLRVEGLVMSVKSTREGAMLNLSSGYTLPFGRIEDIIDPAFFVQAGGAQ